jgi:beta-glucosidase/6-phospho-beta-glucosidase/beta-galactosidase
MFRSYFMAGFECASGYNIHGVEIDQVAATHHDRFLDADYDMVSGIGLKTVREAVRWRLVDKGKGNYDFTTVDHVLDAAGRHGIEVIWDLFHYGYPDDLDLFSTEFVERFAAYCRAVAEHIVRRSDGPHCFTPVNEPSYFAWAAGHAGMFAPHCFNRGYELKCWLVRAAIQGIDAIWSVDPAARIVNVDALCRVVAPPDQPERQGEADYFNNVAVMESWDMLAGRLNPEFGGSPRHLDIIGVNYYWTNQWELGLVGIPLRPDDPRIWSLGDLLRDMHARYGHPMILSETSHMEEKRTEWIEQVGHEVSELIVEGVPIHGVCVYPVLGMPEWHAPDTWTYMGIWDLVHEDGRLIRKPHEPMLHALARARAQVERAREARPIRRSRPYVR